MAIRLGTRETMLALCKALGVSTAEKVTRIVVDASIKEVTRVRVYRFVDGADEKAATEVLAQGTFVAEDPADEDTQRAMMRTLGTVNKRLERIERATRRQADKIGEFIPMNSDYSQSQFEPLRVTARDYVDGVEVLTLSDGSKAMPYAKGAWGLWNTAEGRKLERAACMAAVCRGCREGWDYDGTDGTHSKPGGDGNGFTFHVVCDAQPIRDLGDA